MNITPKTIEALKLLVGTSRLNPISSSILAERLYPDRINNCDTSRRHGSIYRSAGSYYSKLQKMGLVGYWMVDSNRGYFITKLGIEILADNQEN